MNRNETTLVLYTSVCLMPYLSEFVFYVPVQRMVWDRDVWIELSEAKYLVGFLGVRPDSVKLPRLDPILLQKLFRELQERCRSLSLQTAGRDGSLDLVLPLRAGQQGLWRGESLEKVEQGDVQLLPRRLIQEQAANQKLPGTLPKELLDQAVRGVPRPVAHHHLRRVPTHPVSDFLLVQARYLVLWIHRDADTLERLLAVVVRHPLGRHEDDFKSIASAHLQARGPSREERFRLRLGPGVPLAGVSELLELPRRLVLSEEAPVLAKVAAVPSLTQHGAAGSQVL
mmetsp:Transcript_3432/g.9602  ORF Transcript_3432/g.9602 Transcript_3432/m.9602 type:complete len:284 (+) Transcript_3432:841-1692(+)